MERRRWKKKEKEGLAKEESRATKVGMGASLPRSLQFTTEVSRLWLWVVTAVAEVISWLYKSSWACGGGPHMARIGIFFLSFLFLERKKK